ncbi:MAG: hypothetical protein AAFX40_04595 [Cyanobacteria bacterium J06639_1]
MTIAQITELTDEQRDLWPEYRDKWTALAYAVAPIDRDKAGEAVKMAYVLAGYDEPELIYCDSPRAGQRIITETLKQPMGILA